MPQGSDPNGTAVEPEDSDQGEYDVDAVWAAFGPSLLCDASLQDVEVTPRRRRIGSARYSAEVRIR